VEETKQFLDALFAGKESDEHVLIWLLDGRRSAWFKDTDAATAYVQANRARDVYLGVALSPADHGPHVRLKIEGGERKPSSIVALWSDVDILNPGHKKRNLAPSAEDAKSILFPELLPSMVVHSGGGLQPWWIFKEPWRLESEEEIRRAGALATRWIRAIRARAAARGWDIDSVGDLTRVLRVPGTSNCKIPGHPRPVQLIDINDRRYNPTELEWYLDTIGAPLVANRTALVISGEKLTYSTDAEPPFQKFQALCDAEPKFKASWDHKRRDLKDQTASAYDMALANIAVQAGWLDQEIANLLIAHRRRFNEDLKLRDSYYNTTIARAHAAFSEDLLDGEIQQLVASATQPARDEDGEQKEEPPAKEDPAQRKGVICDRLSEKFKLTGPYRIIRITRYMSEPREYAIEIASGDCIRLGDVTNLIEPHKLQAKIAELASRMIPPFKKNAQWEAMQQMLLDACVDVHVGDEGTDAGLVNSWLSAYLRMKPVLDSYDESDETRSPFLRNDRVHVYLSDVLRWIHVNFGERISPKEMGVRMRRAGAVPDKVPHGKSSRQVWMLAESFTPPARSEVPGWVTEEQSEQEIVN
jgi:hypothetical protein